jgi:hypothetical protein
MTRVQENLVKCIKRFVLIAVANAKFHSSLQKASQFVAKTVLDKTGLKEGDSMEEAISEEALMTGQEKCIKQYAMNASKNAKFHSSLQKASQCSAKIALEEKDKKKNSN